MTGDRNSLRAAGFDFLFKKDRGEISRNLWIRGAVAIAAPVALASIGWLALSPFATRGLSDLGAVDLLTIVAYLYLIAFAFGGLIAAICFYNLSAKRFRARGRPAAFAGLALIAAFIASTASALEAGADSAITPTTVHVLAGVCAVIILWTIWELGVAPDRERKP